MNANRFFVALAVGLLTAPEDLYARACARVSEFYDLDRLYRPGRAGAAVWEQGEERMCMLPWLARKREQLCSVHVEVREPDHQHGPHLLAGFAGGLPIVARIRSQGGTADYVAGTVSGPRLLMTTSDLIKLLHRQGDPALYWACLLSEVNSFNQCNGRDEIDLAELPTYLQTSAGSMVWEFIGEQVFRELQVEACVHDRDFILPDEMRALVRAVEPFGESANMHVWLEPFDEDIITGTHLLQLVEAQAFARRIWELCADKAALQERLGDDYILDDIPVIRAEDWPRHLVRLAAEDVTEFRDEIIELVRQECEFAGIDPVIPEDLRDIFGPDEEERRRLWFRRRMQYDMGWALVPTEEPWMLAVLDKVGGAPAYERSLPMDQARMEFIRTLERVEQFARQIESGFAKLFGVARDLAVLAGKSDNADPATIFDQRPDQYEPVRDLIEKTIDVFSGFGWAKGRTFGLAAVSVADVFGGMGSWNDQWFEGPEQETFERLSAELFDVLNRYFETLVSVER